MAITGTPNLQPTNTADAIWLMLVFLQTKGFLVKAAGDGLAAYSAANGTALTGSGTGANGLNNNKAWFRLQSPDTQREWVFQRGSTSVDNWRVKYSYLAKFTGSGGGAIGATICPTATDEQVIIAGGTDAAPTGGIVLVSGFATPHRFTYWVDDASPYGWGFYAWSSPAGTIQGGFIFDCMVTGTYPTASDADADPTMHYVINGVGTNGNTFGNFQSNEGAPPVSAFFGWYKAGLAGAAWVQFVAPGLYHDGGSNRVVPGNLPANPYNAKDDAFPLFYTRRIAQSQSGWKGVSKYLRYMGPTRPNLSTNTESATKDRIVIGLMSFPWHGVDPLL